MEQCNQFKHLVDAVSRYTDTISFPGKCFAHGEIMGYTFRIFQEIDTDNGTGDEYCAFLCIDDENSSGSMWSAFYNATDLEEWVSKRVK